jgi:hypothetical protein
VFRWVRDNKDAIRECRPDLDRDLMNNRQRDNTSTLLQIADVIGPNCAADSREALKVMTSGDTLDPSETLLGDIATILTDPDVLVGDPPKTIGSDNAVFTGDLCDLIVQYYPYREAYQSLTQARVATMLRRFDIEPEPRCKRRGKQVLHWYRRNAFDEWFVRYGFGPIEKIEGSDVAAFVGDEAADSFEDAGDPDVVPESEPPTGATPLQEAYPKAHHEKWGRGDMRKGDKLRRAVDADVHAGKIEAGEITFASALFWILRRDERPFWAHVNGIEKLELLPIEAPGPVADNEAGVVINPTKTLCMAESDYQKYRALVNKALKFVL